MSNIVKLYKCDNCEKVITYPAGGLVIHGNIYVADPTTKGGMIGDNFPETDCIDGCASVKDSVKESVLCVPCFLRAVLPTHNLTTTRGFFDVNK